MELKTLSTPLKHPLNALYPLDPLSRRLKKQKKITAALRALRPLRALRGKMQGTEGNINQSQKLSREQRCSEMTVPELLADLERQGFILIPLPEGKLAVKPAEKLTNPLR